VVSRDSSDVAALATGTGERVVVERADLQGTLRRIGFSVVASPSTPAAAPSWVAELDGHAALCRMPRTSSGEPDVGSLSFIPLVTDDQLAEFERLLQSLPGIREGAVVPSQWPRPESPLHLDQLLPRQLRAESGIAEERAAVSEPLPMRATELPWASVDGEALREPPPFETLVDVMLAAVSRSRDDDLTFVNFDGTVVRQSLADLLQSAKRILGGLLASGLEPGCRVVLQLDSNAELLASFWACLLGGCPPVIVPVPPSYVEPNRGSDQLAHVVTSLDRPWLVTNQSRVADLTAWIGERRLACAEVLAFEPLQTFSPSERVHRPKPSDTAFFSTSSGSTGQPKCVGLTHRGLIDRAAGTNQLCEHSRGDVILNWLPLDHIGSISDWHLRCLLVGCRMVYVPKEFVISEPMRWLDLIHAHRITHSWAPNFAYSLIRDALAKQPAAALVGRWDLSCVVGLLTAGEAVSPKVVSEFLALLKPFGFAETAIRPAFSAWRSWDQA
jgi:non-ribosomal peptide synthetase component F